MHSRPGVANEHQAVGALLDLILFFVFPFQEVYMSVALWLPKLYANAMIMVINARLKIVSSTSYEDHVHMMSFRTAGGVQATGVDVGHLAVTVTKDVSTFSDTLEMKKLVSRYYSYDYYVLTLAV